MSGPLKATLRSFPELKYWQDEFYMVYASTFVDHSIVSRSTLELVKEVRDAYHGTPSKKPVKKIIFFNSSETFLFSVLFKVQTIAELCKEIPKKDLIFTVGVPHAQEFYDQTCEKYGWDNRLTVIGAHHFEQTIYWHTLHQPDLNQPYEIKEKEKLFVCFNKLHRHHRLRFLAAAIKNDWLKKSFFSFEGQFPGWLEPENYSKLPLISDEEYKQILSIKDKLPLRLNITESRHNPVDVCPDDLIYHQESYFSVVAETLYEPYDSKKSPFFDYMDTLFLSEKIYKPLALKHPFIAIAWHGTLKVLQERGYKTFHPYIDESYDNEQDPDKRFDMIVKEIKRLEKFTKNEWLEWQKNIKPIVEYNYKYLLSLTDHRVGPPIDSLFED